jgi:hypothetical protein
LNPSAWLDPYRDAEHQPCPVHFVSPAEQPLGEAYESFFDRTGKVPTRPNRHDHFNRLVWQAFPLLIRTCVQSYGSNVRAELVEEPVVLAGLRQAQPERFYTQERVLV